VDGDDQARRAEAALDAAALDQGRLHRGHVVLVGGLETFQGGDLATGGRRGQDQAGAHQVPVEQDRAGAALTLFAAAFRPLEAKALPQHMEKTLALPGSFDLVIPAIDRQVIRQPGQWATTRCNARRASTPMAWRR
jgi:hypothetical protein